MPGRCRKATRRAARCDAPHRLDAGSGTAGPRILRLVGFGPVNPAAAARVPAEASRRTIPAKPAQTSNVQGSPGGYEVVYRETRPRCCKPVPRSDPHRDGGSPTGAPTLDAMTATAAPCGDRFHQAHAAVRYSPPRAAMAGATDRWGRSGAYWLFPCARTRSSCCSSTVLPVAQVAVGSA